MLLNPHYYITALYCYSTCLLFQIPSHYMMEHVFKLFCQRPCRLYVFCNFDPKRQCFDVILTWDERKITGWCIQRWKNSGTGGYLLWLSEVQRSPVSQSDQQVLKWLLVRHRKVALARQLAIHWCAQCAHDQSEEKQIWPDITKMRSNSDAFT